MTTEQYRSKSGFSIFLSFFKPHRGLFFLDMVCALIVALVDLAYPIISRYAMRTLLPQNAFGTLPTWVTHSASAWKPISAPPCSAIFRISALSSLTATAPASS